MEHVLLKKYFLSFLKNAFVKMWLSLFILLLESLRKVLLFNLFFAFVASFYFYEDIYVCGRSFRILTSSTLLSKRVPFSDWPTINHLLLNRSQLHCMPYNHFVIFVFYFMTSSFSFYLTTLLFSNSSSILFFFLSFLTNTLSPILKFSIFVFFLLNSFLYFKLFSFTFSKFFSLQADRGVIPIPL
ncbi:hypothetical protein H311_01426 [Anncaliia algerae PRA109]|nr:hypothetical protein H311_01426 [Anncaliia algerae PRA109]